MLLILFKIDNERFGLDASRVIEVLPMVSMKKAHGTPIFVAGLLNFRGTVVPVIDISALITDTPAKQLLSTRIMLVLYTDSHKDLHVLGLLAEHVIETINVKEEEFHPPGIESDNARYLGKVRIDEKGILQLVEVDELLPESVQELLLS